MKDKRNIIIIIGIIAFIIIIGGVSFSYFVYNKNLGDVSISMGEMSINYSDTNGNMNLTGIVPKSDAEGRISTDYIDFTVDGVVDTESILYELDVIPSVENTLNSQFIKLYLTDQSDNCISGPFLYSELYDPISNNGKAVYQEIIDAGNSNLVNNYTKEFRLRVWIDENYIDTTSKNFDFDLNIYSINVDINDLSVVNYDFNDGRKIVKYYQNGETHDNYPHPIKDGYNFVGWNYITGSLPSNYVRYEYIETAGAQYIDSGYVYNNNTSTKVDFMTPDSIPTNVSTVLFYSGSTSNIGFALGSSSTSGKSRAFYKAAWNGDFLSTNTRYSLFFDKEKLYLNDSLIHTFSEIDFTVPYSMPFFAQYYTSTSPINYAASGTRIYIIKIYQDDNLVRYLIPALNNTTNSLGFYDMVNDTFYDNLGTGYFSGVVDSNPSVDEEFIDNDFAYPRWEISNS